MTMQTSSPRKDAMSDDLVSLRLLLVSEAAIERELLRRAASTASIPIDVVEPQVASDPAATCDLLAQDHFDAVFIDSRMPRAGREAVLTAARAASARPLVILVGAAELRTREVLTDGLAVDGVLAKPIDTGEACALLNACARARQLNRVLIVNDSASVRSVVRKVLHGSRFRFEADEAEDEASALDKATQQPFDIVLLDVSMNGFDGLGALAELQGRTPDTKVVIIASTNDPSLAERARAAGARDVLLKPFYPKDVDAALARLLGLMRSRWN
jgi:CheY-like chemotaxis protein